MPASAKKKKTNAKKKNNSAKVKVTKGGPYIVTGSVPLDRQTIVTDGQGYPTGYRKDGAYQVPESYSLCRCGKSSKHPFCDGSHGKTGFKGNETANFKPYSETADVTEGPDLVLTDAEEFCASARFCDRAGGTWHLTRRSDNAKAKKTAIQEAGDCPAGRLVTWDKKTGKPIEPDHEPSITIIEDPAVGSSGPVWVKGGIPVESANGKAYEVRNRVTLCRCGASENKPFCDGMHRAIQFDDGTGDQ
jgi:CDGSH-type Zn-finger protein